ncbi:MAG: hypothetical protein SPF28_02225, partial [Eubacteriales bacterium]|nr:hypothetical protein [Eubacteriales bacterium]
RGGVMESHVGRADIFAGNPSKEEERAIESAIRRGKNVLPSPRTTFSKCYRLIKYNCFFNLYHILSIFLRNAFDKCKLVCYYN